MPFGSWQFKAGDKQQELQGTFRQWVTDYSDRLFALAYRLCGDREVAEELVQESFYQGWRSMHQLRDCEKAKPWLMQILRHCYARG